MSISGFRLQSTHFNELASVQTSFAKFPICDINANKAGYMATPVACGWAGTVMEKVSGAFGQEQ